MHVCISVCVCVCDVVGPYVGYRSLRCVAAAWKRIVPVIKVVCVYVYVYVLEETRLHMTNTLSQSYTVGVSLYIATSVGKVHACTHLKRSHMVCV